MPALEKFIMNASRRGEINASVDHVAKTINFVAAPADPNRLSNLAIYLHNAIQFLNPAPVVSRAEAFAAALAEAEEERKRTEHRRLIVQKRRELMEEANLRREREESAAKAERAKQLAEENARLQKEAIAKADMDRLQRQMDATRREEALKLAEQLAKGGLKVDISEMKDEDLDTSKIVAMQVEQIAKEKRDMNERLRIVAKRVDHLERAYRQEERKLLPADYERQKKEDRETYDRAVAADREAAKAQQARDIELKVRLQRIMPDYLVARKEVESQREAEFEAARRAAAQKIEQEKQKFLNEVLARRHAEKERRERERAEAEEAERRRQEKEAEEARLAAEREEQEARARAEIEARNREAAERAARQKAEREAERAKLDEIARKQREREEEAERRRLERASGAGARRAPEPAAAPAAGTRPPLAGLAGGSWREKLAAKKAAEAAGGAAPAASAPNGAPTRPPVPAARATPPSPERTPVGSRSSTPGAPAAAPADGATPPTTSVYRPGQGKWSARGRGGSPAPTRGGAAGRW